VLALAFGRQQLYALWTNLCVISTVNESTLWKTSYPDVGFPRMSGVATNSEAVFVAFSTVRWERLTRPAP
jgi:hypothetical protein